MSGKNGSLLTIGAICFIAMILSICVLRWAFGVGTGVVDRVVSPEAIINNYEWYETQYRDVKAAEGQIKDAEEAIVRFKSDSGASKEWRFDQREEYARLNANLQGLKSYRRTLVEAYNAKASMITRSMWKSGSLPHHIDQ